MRFLIKKAARTANNGEIDASLNEAVSSVAWFLFQCIRVARVDSLDMV